MKKILVVDDNKCIRAALSMMMTSSMEDWLVVTAENGAVAAALFDALPIQAVLSDISMPVMDGFQLIAHIRARSSSVPIIAMSGESRQDIQDRLRSFGVDRLLEKPFDFEKAVREVALAVETAAPAGKAAPEFVAEPAAVLV